MPKQAAGLLLDMIALDRGSDRPLYRQLDDQLREAVLSGRLPPGARLPATRQLAAELGLSRLTVQNAYEQLVAEGFLASAVGAGTFVADIAPENLPPAQPAPPQRQASPRRRGPSRRGRRIAETRATTRIAETAPFRPGVPDPELFPMAIWSRLWARALRRAGRDLFGYAPPGGHAPLRAAIVEHLRNARGVRCDPEQVIVTAGAQQSFALSALALLDPGEPAWVEDPGHAAGRDVLTLLGVQAVPVAIDGEGLSVADGRAREPAPRLIFVTPSHQHPLGMTMSLRRRLELLQFARRADAWILEDDYDSEFRYSGRPLPALQGLDGGERVIYAGSFSKVLYPSLRMGYLVVPHDLVETFRAAQTVLSHGVPVLPQMALADFMRTGRFAAHVRRMRVAYGERRKRLIAALREHAAGLLEPEPADAGMHLVAWLPEGADDMAAARTLWAEGLEALPLSIYCQRPYPRAGLLLGFTAVAPERIAPEVARLARALRSSRESPCPSGPSA